MTREEAAAIVCEKREEYEKAKKEFEEISASELFKLVEKNYLGKYIHDTDSDNYKHVTLVKAIGPCRLYFIGDSVSIWDDGNVQFLPSTMSRYSNDTFDNETGLSPILQIISETDYRNVILEATAILKNSIEEVTESLDQK